MISRARRISYSLAALTGSVALGFAWVGHGVASGDDRTISFYHIHTKETLTVQYKNCLLYTSDAADE